MDEAKRIQSVSQLLAIATGRVVEGVRVSKVKADGVGLHQVVFRDSLLEGSDMQGADFSQSRLEGVKFHGVRMRGFVATGSVMEKTTFEGCELMEADFSGTRLFGVQIRVSNATNMKLRSSEVVNGKFIDSELYHVDFSGVTMVRTRFKDFRRHTPVLNASNFSGALLIDVDLRAANLQGADFSGALLLRVNLDDANIIDTNFQGALLVGCSMERLVGPEPLVRSLMARNVSEEEWRRPVLDFFAGASVNTTVVIEALLSAYVTGMTGERGPQGRDIEIPEPQEEPSLQLQKEESSSQAESPKTPEPEEEPSSPPPKSGSPIDDPGLYERYKKLELD